MLKVFSERFAGIEVYSTNSSLTETSPQTITPIKVKKSFYFNLRYGFPLVPSKVYC